MVKLFDVIGNVVEVGDYIAYATTEFRSVQLRIHKVLSIHENGMCGVDAYDEQYIGAIGERGIKLSNYIPK